MKAEQRAELAALPLFRGLDEAGLEALLRGASLQRYPRGTLLFEEGEPADFLHVAVEGTIELFTASGDQQATVLIAWPPECFILAAALTGEPYLMSARTLGPSRLLLVPAGQFREEVRRNAALALHATAALAGQFRMAVRQIKDLKLRTGPQRLAAFLMRLVDETGIGGGAELPIPKATLASRLGMTPESLSRALSLLRGYGLEVNGTTVRIIDRARLEQYCAPNALIDGSEGPLHIID